MTTAAERAAALEQIDTAVASVNPPPAPAVPPAVPAAVAPAAPVVTPSPPAPETAAQKAEREKAELLTNLSKYRAEKVRAGASEDELQYIDSITDKVRENVPGAAASATKALDDANWDRSIGMFKDGADRLLRFAVPEMNDPGSESGQVVENLGIFGRGVLSSAWDWSKGALDYMRTEHPLLTRGLGGGLMALMAMQFVNPMIDNSLGKIPVIGGLLSGLVKILGFLGITLGGMGLLSGYTQGNGSHTSSEAAAGPNTRTSHTGNLEDVPTGPDGMDAGQTRRDQSHMERPRADNDNDEGSHAPDAVRDARERERRLEVVPATGGDARIIRVGGSAPTPGPTGPVLDRAAA